MRCIIQRVTKASVSFDNQKNSIRQGLLILAAILEADNLADVKRIALKIMKLRIFDDENGVMNKSLIDIKGEILLIPQFTLYADIKKGNRPYYGMAASPEKARIIISELKNQFSTQIAVKDGYFGEKMNVSLINNGPVTIIVDSNEI